MTDEGLGKGGKAAGYHLQLFGVHPDYQRKGVGSALDFAVESEVSNP
jgi:GNAT superfamily N-acetyltransferase